MGVYYDYYLEKKEEDGWHRLNALEEGNDASIYYHSGSYGCDYVRNYEIRQLSFEELAEETKDIYRESYDNCKEAKRYDYFYPYFYELSIDLMFKDFDEGIHEYAGIITRNDRLKIERNSEYIPETISVEDFNKLPEGIKDNYVFYVWDSPWSDYVHTYELVPIIRDMLKTYNLSIDDVRLTCKQCQI